MNKPVRLQNAFVSEGEVKKIVDFIANNNEAEIPVEIVPAQAGNDGVGMGNAVSSGGGGGGFGDEEDVDDDMYQQARQAVVENQKASTSFLQRKLRIGYARAARIVDLLEQRGVIGPGDGAKAREVIEKGGGTPAPSTPEEGM